MSKDTAVGQREHQLGRGGDGRGEPAEHRHRGHPVAGGEAGAVRGLAHRARDLAAEQEGQVGLHLVLAAAEQQVGEDDAGRLHVDEHLAVADRGLVDLGDLDRVRPVEPDDLYRAHRDLPFRPTGPSAVTVLQERGGDVR